MMMMALAVVMTVAALSISTSDAAAKQLTVAQVIVAQDKIFVTSPGYRLLAHFKLKSITQARAAIPKLEHTRKLLERAASVVTRVPAATNAERIGRRDWVAGAHLVATGIGELAAGLDDLVKGNRTAADMALKLSVSTDKRGGALAAEGDKLLGLPRTD